MTFARGSGRDGTEVEALITDRYLESLLVAHGSGGDGAPAPAALPPALRDAADRLARSLPRVHPSFRFEEALSARLLAAALARRLPAAAGAEGQVIALPIPPFDDDAALAAYLGQPDAPDDPDLVRPLLIGGALTSAALSIAGAAFVAWRRRRLMDASGPLRAVKHGRLA